MSFRMTANDWMRLDYALERIADAEAYGMEPDPEDIRITELYSGQ